MKTFGRGRGPFMPLSCQVDTFEFACLFPTVFPTVIEPRALAQNNSRIANSDKRLDLIPGQFESGPAQASTFLRGIRSPDSSPLHRNKCQSLSHGLYSISA